MAQCFWNKKNRTQDIETRKSQEKNSGEKEHKPIEEKSQAIFHKKVNLEKAHAISVESLEIFHRTILMQHPTQKINGHSKQQQKVYVLGHIRLNSKPKKKQ